MASGQKYPILSESLYLWGFYGHILSIAMYKTYIIVNIWRME